MLFAVSFHGQPLQFFATREGLWKGLEERVAAVVGEAPGSELVALCFALAALEPLFASKELDQNGPGRRSSSEFNWTLHNT